MKNRAAGIWATVVALLLLSLSALSLLAGRENYGNLLLVAPFSLGQPGPSAEKLEELSEEEFLLTYEIRQPATARAIQSNHAVTLVGTNHNYAGVMGYVALDGGFFTKAAMEAKNKHAVLNETAAFAMFGSSRIAGSAFRLNGETWIAVGVIQDGDAENARIYVPAGVTGGQAGSIMVLMDEAAVSEAHVKNALKSIGIQETGYDFINLSKSAGAFEGRFTVAWKAALLAVILLFLAGTGGGLLEQLRRSRDRMRSMYLGELLARHWAALLKTAGLLLLLAAGIGAALALSLQILETCLAWQELGAVTGELCAGDFGHKLQWLRDHETSGWILFGACVCVILLCLILSLSRRARSAGRRAGTQELPALHSGSEPA